MNHTSDKAVGLSKASAHMEKTRQERKDNCMFMYVYMLKQ